MRALSPIGCALVLVFGFALTLTFPFTAFAGELVRLPIKEVQQNRQGAAVQLVVTVEFQACKYAYKGLYLESVSTGQGQQSFRVVALASERISGTCADRAEPRTDSLLVNAANSDRYDFIPLQPR